MALTVHNGSEDQDWTAGERLLEDVFDLIRRRLPELAVDDPVRPAFARILPSVGRSLGRPTATLVRDD